MSQQITHTYNTIPDISYHLIFCFLPLRELPQVARCCKEWKRIVTAPSFLNMFRHEDVLEIEDEKKLCSTAGGSFRHVIRDIIIKYIWTKSSAITFLINFHRIQSLELEIGVLNLKLDITPLFKALAHRLRHLKVNFSHWSVNVDDHLNRFQNALSLLVSLTSLTLIDDLMKGLNYILFLSQMKKLKSFHCNGIYYLPSEKDIIDCFRDMPDLIDLELDSFSYIEFVPHGGIRHNLNLLNELISEKHKFKLKHLGNFNIGHTIDCKFDDALCEHLLNKLEDLQTIKIKLQHSLINIPKQLGKWIQHLEISQMNFSDQHVIDILSLPYLKFIKIKYCEIKGFQMKTLIHGLSHILETYHFEHGMNQISFKDLSECFKLKSIYLMDIVQLNAEEFDSLLSCKHLESIHIRHDKVRYPFCGFNLKANCKMHHALKIPSKAFPNLKVVDINYGFTILPCS
jgi:hypothetical protein